MDDLRARAAAITAKIFETMFFLFIEAQEESGARQETEKTRRAGSSSSYLKSIIQVRGGVTGQVGLYLPRGLAQGMAANFLGLEEGATESQALDMAGELLNMIAGNLLSTGSEKVRYKLAMPEMEFVEIRDWPGKGSGGGVTLDFEVEGQRIRLHIQLSWENKNGSPQEPSDRKRNPLSAK